MNIQFEGVVPHPMRDYFKNKSVSGFDFNFESGKYYLLDAGSGKGKSTILSIIYGLRADFEGKVTLDGSDIKQFKSNQWAELRQNKISFLFQSLDLFGQLSALENITLKQKLSSVTDSLAIEKMAQKLGVEDLLSKNVCQLSMGQQQRIALIRALVQDCDWLLLDEPFSHLDEENRIIMEEIILEFCQEKGAGLILTNLGNPVSIPFHHTYKLC